MDLLLPTRTTMLIEAVMKRPPASLLIAGPSHTGKKTIAFDIAQSLLGITSLENYPYLYIASADRDENKKSISIEQIKQLIKNLQLKPVGSRAITQIALIEEAHLLTNEAANALLKILEEPPQKTMFILTSSTKEKLLPTILSRVSIITLEIPSLAKTIDHFKEYTPSDIEKAYLKSGGAPGLVKKILAGEVDDTEAIALAKQILTSSTYDRLILVDKLAKQKDLLENVLHTLVQLLNSLLRKQPSTEKTKVNASKMKLVLETEKRLKKNGNTKLLLTHLMLNM